MILKKIKVRTPQENLLTNTYVVCDEKTKETMVIDPGGEIDKIVEILNILESNLKYIILTHCHSDHTNGLKLLKDIIKQVENSKVKLIGVTCKVNKEKIAITEITVEIKNKEELNKLRAAIGKVESVYEVKRKRG